MARKQSFKKADVINTCDTAISDAKELLRASNNFPWTRNSAEAIITKNEKIKEELKTKPAAFFLDIANLVQLMNSINQNFPLKK